MVIFVVLITYNAFMFYIQLNDLHIYNRLSGNPLLSSLKS